MGWHADDEKELGDEPVIASVSLGAERRFLLRSNETGEKVETRLPSGSLLVMQGRSQHDWKHAVPKTKVDIGERINLTFRRIQM
jgi:alkylated DNA repair dioxygenase AlkB